MSSRYAKLRADLRAEGANEQLIEKIIERQIFDDDVARVGLSEARRLARARIHDPDDSGYEPKRCDPLLRGPARVTGITAKVVRRRNTITRFQHKRLTLTEESE